MLTVHAMGWNQRKEDGLHIALSSRFKKTVEKTCEVSENLKKLQDQMHCCDGMLKQWVADVKQWASSDRNKRRQKITQKIAKEKKRLLEEIVRYNQKPDVDLVDTSSVVQNLSSKADERMIWPWQEQNKDGVDILTKKKLFDLHMLASRLAEEKEILVKEMMQHCQYLKEACHQSPVPDGLHFREHTDRKLSEWLHRKGVQRPHLCSSEKVERPKA
ncbi:unnamed protein product [Arctogadus glacialis]